MGKTDGFDTLTALASEFPIDESQMTAFVNKYVEEIYVKIDNASLKIFPTFSYSASKLTVRFKNGQHMLVEKYPKTHRISLWAELNEIVLKDRDMQRLEKFHNALMQYGYIR